MYQSYSTFIPIRLLRIVKKIQGCRLCAATDPYRLLLAGINLTTLKKFFPHFSFNLIQSLSPPAQCMKWQKPGDDWKVNLYTVLKVNIQFYGQWSWFYLENLQITYKTCKEHLEYPDLKPMKPKQKGKGIGLQSCTSYSPDFTSLTLSPGERALSNLQRRISQSNLLELPNG